MNWQQQQVNLYSNHKGGTKYSDPGKVRTLRQVLFSDFGDNIGEIVKLRALDRNAPDYDEQKRKLKAKLQCHTTAAELWTRDDEVPELERIVKKTGLTQMDIDHVEAQGFDIEELKQFIFSFPFTCFVSRSCSGDGIFAIMAIAEPDKLAEYMQHIHRTFEDNGIKIDTGKGKKYSDLRYCSYDENMLWRDEVEPIRIKHFKTVSAPVKRLRSNTTKREFNGDSSLYITNRLQLIKQSTKGNRWQTVCRVAYEFGGRKESGFELQKIIDTINASPQFAGYESHCIKEANKSFKAGSNNPLLPYSDYLKTKI